MTAANTGTSAAPGVAYFTMEIALEPGIRTYSGGLGVLAGDTVKAAADLGVPMVGVTLLYRQGYFRQELDERGAQHEHAAAWSPDERLDELDLRIQVEIEGRTVHARAWRYTVDGYTGGRVPVYLLDTDLPENSAADRRLTDRLYGGDRRYRLAQEALLGIGGVALLRRLGHGPETVYHMNEGHSALLGLALLEERARSDGAVAVEAVDDDAIATVRDRCVFTTHTPVPAGHDRFSIDLVRRVLGSKRADVIERVGGIADGTLNMTLLALGLSSYVNGVAMRHGQVSREMFPGYPITSITNGVHARTWAAPALRELFDRHAPGWRGDSFHLRNAIGIPLDEVREAHAEAKKELLDEVARRTDRRLDPAVLTLGFARRATPYKRADLLFSDLDRLRAIAREGGGLQIVYAGKAHPRDEEGKAMIRRVSEAGDALGEDLPVVYLQDYDMTLGALITSGVDVWLNTPRKPQEASGTSGMKAALNGVPSLSVLDGWWVEGHIEGVTGWAIGDHWRAASDARREAASLYQKLETAVLPMFYDDPDAFARVMRAGIALNASYFHTQRMVYQYAVNAYGLPIRPGPPHDAADAPGG